MGGREREKLASIVSVMQINDHMPPFTLSCQGATKAIFRKKETTSAGTLGLLLFDLQRKARLDLNTTLH